MAFEPKLTENALVVLRSRYLAKDENGRVIETPEEMFRRVARNLVLIDILYDPEVYVPAGSSDCRNGSREKPAAESDLVIRRTSEPLGAPYTEFDRLTLERAYWDMASRGHMKVDVDQVVELLRKRRPELQRREEELYRAMAGLDFLFNSPTLMNAGRELQQLSACFVLPVEDSLESIFDTIKHTALIHQSGGGCVAGDALVHTTFCGVEEIATLYERVRSTGVLEMSGERHHVMDVRHLGIRTMSLDPETGSFEPKRVTHLWRWDVPASEQITVRFSNGTSVTASSWHPFLVFAGRGVEERKASELRPGDVTVIPNHSVARNWPIKEYREVAGLCLDEDLAWLAGYFLGDGSLGWFRNRVAKYRALRLRFFDGRRESLEFARTVLAKQGVRVRIRRDARGLFSLTTTNRSFVEPFAQLVQAKPGPKDQLTLPSDVTKSPLAVVCAFLGGLVDSDGYVSVSRRRVVFSTACPDLACRLQALVSLLGFSPAMRTKPARGRGKAVMYDVKLSLSTKSRELAGMLLPWVHDPLKRQRLASLLQVGKGGAVHNTHSRVPIAFEHIEDLLRAAGVQTHGSGIHRGPVSVGGETFWLHRMKWGSGINEAKLERLVAALRRVLPASYSGRLDRLESLARGWTTVSEVIPAEKPQAFYDFTVEGYNNYLAGIGGLAVVHNTGFSFSRLRPKDDIVKSTGGVASGPVSFMRVFDSATNAIKQGGTRRGANMGILRCDHPDVLEFIDSKTDDQAITNFNISVALTDAFMDAVAKDEEYELRSPRTGMPVRKLKAREVFDLISNRAWANGEPGVIFIDRINEGNPTPHIGSIESTNPCGEQPLLPYESCNLASLNLARVVAEGPKPEIDFDRLGSLVELAIHYLDNVIDANRYPMPEIEWKTKANRKVGLGVMGWADLLIKLGIPYDSEEALALADKVMGFIADRSKLASANLAAERGAFPNYAGSALARPGSRPVRNATTTTIAPTGTISIIAGASSGIEPLFSIAFTRKGILGGQELIEVNPLFRQVAKARGFESDALMLRLAEVGTIAEMEEVPADVRRLFVTALDIDPEWQIRMQAAFQRHTDNAVSKTVNLPFEATPDDIRRIYRMAFDLGCKGVTVYRNGSRRAQVLNVGKKSTDGGAQGASGLAAPRHEEGVAAAVSAGSVVPARLERGPWGKVKPIPRPEGLSGVTVRKITPLGNLYLTLNVSDGQPFEVFAQLGKAGSDVAAFTEGIARLISLALRCGIDPNEVASELAGIGGNRSVGFGPNRIRSVPDAIARFLDDYLSGNIAVSPGQARKAGQLVMFENGQGGKEGAEVGESSAIDRKESGEEAGGLGHGSPGGVPRPSGRGFDLCPSCGMHSLAYEEGCLKCRSCGYSEC